MKGIIIILSLLIISFTNSYGQWYVKKYNVSDINLLSRQQLLESLKNTKNDIIGSGVVTAVGAIVYILGKNSVFEINDDSSDLEKIIGKKGVNNIAQVTGAAVVVGGSIFMLSYIGRQSKIKTALIKQDQSFGSVYISPKIFSNNHLESYHFWVSLTCNF